MFKIRIRHTKRYKEIINAFLRNGLSHFLFRLGLTKRDAKHEGQEMNLQDIGVKLRESLQELGPTFIKLGQIASSRRDLIPPTITLELEKLQDHVNPVPFEDIRKIIEVELQGPLADFFSDISEQPLAAASIGQVHAATLHSGEQVAVKVQRPDIRPTMETDLAILDDLAGFLESKTEWAKTYRLRQMIVEFSKSLQDELDYRVEGRNCERIGQQFEEQREIVVPKVYWDFSTDKVLTTERIQGIKANDLKELTAGGYDRKLVARRIVDSMLHQILEEGFFHGDPHPGNIFVLPDNIVSYLDFGMVGRLDSKTRYHFAPLILHLRNQNTEGIIDILAEMGILSDETDVFAFSREMNELQSKYYDVPLDELSLGTVFIELFQAARRHHIFVPTEIAVLGKSILTLEGLISKLDPDLNIMEAVEPFGKRLMWKRYNPKNVIEKSWVGFIENFGIISHFPKDLKAVATAIRKGRLQLDFNAPQFQKYLHMLDRISNRLSFSIALLSFSILLGAMIIGTAITGKTNVLLEFPIIEAGAIIAMLMFLFLIFTIIRSGRL